MTLEMMPQEVEPLLEGNQLGLFRAQGQPEIGQHFGRVLSGPLRLLFSGTTDQEIVGVAYQVVLSIGHSQIEGMQVHISEQG